MFYYLPLPRSESGDGIRLVGLLSGQHDEVIRCELRTVQLSDNPRYEAVSYTWGSLGGCKDIELDGLSFAIRLNLWNFLDTIRPSESSLTLWIDSICIDQSSMVERSHTSNEAENSDLVFESLATHSKRAEATPPAAASNDLIAPLRRSDVSLAMAGLCSRPYWRRTWIMQEIVLAAEIVLHCGLCRIEWDVLADVLRTLGQWKEEEVVTGLDNASVDVREYWTIIANSQATRLVLQRDSGVRETDLLKLVERYRDMECTDSRDRIYGLFGLLAPGALGMNANYAVSAFGLFLTVMDTFTPLQPVRIGHLLYEVLGLRDYEHTIRAIVARRTVQLGTVKISTHLVGTVVKSAAAPLSTGPRIRRYSFAFSTILSYGGIITEGPSLVSSSAIGCYTKRLLRTSDKVFQIGDTDIVIVHSPGNGPGTHDDREPFLHYGLIFRGERAVDFHQKYEPYMDQFFDEVDRSFVDDRAFVVRVLENYQAIRLETATFLQAIGLGGDCFDVREWKWPLSSEAAELKMTLCAQGTVNSER